MIRSIARASTWCACIFVAGALLGAEPKSDRGTESSIPWPLGRSPSTLELQALITEAIELHDRERTEEFLEALEKGEDSEHIFLLQERIDRGELDLEALFDFGDGFFDHVFRSGDGLGDRTLPPFRRVHDGLRGGLDTFSCAGCHSKGGPNGAGAYPQSAFVEGDGVSFDTANTRNPPALLGVGLVQALGAEMTRELQEQRDGASAEAARNGKAVTVSLSAKQVPFGELTAWPDGRLDTRKVEGVSDDLLVRPFGWKGEVARLRRFVETAARIHFGIQSHPSALRHKEKPDPARMGGGEHWYDPDGDGKQRELEDGTLTAAAVYLAMLEVPVILPPRNPGLLERWARGNELFDRVGCNACHRRTLKLHRNEWKEVSDTTSAEPVVLRPLQDGEQPRGTEDVELFSDLRRHEMGPELADPSPNGLGVSRSAFLTRPLWGLAETAPYMHDGRAATVPQAIEAHGGQAATARDRYRKLEADQQVDLRLFLLSLTRQPKVRIAR